MTAGLTGVQRYVGEILRFSESQIEPIAPMRPLRGVGGHIWEQVALPIGLRGRMLWSPANTGPVAVARQVLTLHDLAPIDHPEWVTPQFALWYRHLWNLLLPRVAHIITISNFTRSRLLQYYDIPSERITVIHNGVDDRFHRRTSGEIDTALMACGVVGRRYVLSVCALVPRKNLVRLLQAWEQALCELPDDVTLVLVGNVGDRTIFSSLNFGTVPSRVQFLGHVDDEYLPALMSGALMFIYVSLYEGFGLPPLEAIACGTATISSDVTAMPEVLGDAALLVDPEDTSAIARAMILIASDSVLRTNLQNRGPEKAGQFSWRFTARRTINLFSEIIRQY